MKEPKEYSYVVTTWTISPNMWDTTLEHSLVQLLSAMMADDITLHLQSKRIMSRTIVSTTAQVIQTYYVTSLPCLEVRERTLAVSRSLDFDSVNIEILGLDN